MTDDGDDDGTRAMLALRRSRGVKMLGTGAAIAGFAAWWIRNGLDEQGDPAMIWGPGGVVLLIAVLIAIAGIVTIATKSKL